MSSPVTGQIVHNNIDVEWCIVIVQGETQSSPITNSKKSPAMSDDDICFMYMIYAALIMSRNM